MRVKHLLILTALSSIIFLSSCAGNKSMELSYENPVWDGYLADPHIFRAEGSYYAVGTGQAEDGRHFPIVKSDDFVNWEHTGGALEPLEEPNLELYWAPEIAERDGKFYLYYAGDMNMRVAVAESPEGPYEDAGIKLFPDLEFSIDGHPYKDPVSGEWYLFFAKDFFDKKPGTALAVVKLGDDMLSTEGQVHTVMRAFSDWQIYERNRDWYDKTWPAWYTVEGPAVLHKDGKYYCFYSGGNWQTPGYGVGCAVSKDITGPYKDPWSESEPSVLSSDDTELIGPGHNSVIKAPDGQTWFIVYHSWNSEQTKRQMCIDPLIWTSEGPKCFNPSRGEKTVSLPLND
ncbi:Extracellular endo-alpha-(1-_5)-L-arabinanase 1 precursor [Sedimentisphaera cyanobacteriorum]|uniref:Extracellular endo-alpha-(1->5)-L-arabinanase 1 n=1 Tax=Sedimentisphaera cyanobacteriorum TaxID=1940790 RepID=A0A1Q2HQR4_9BACT|nr:glycoside hydrolase family 43 protein [Sedimentisphaera cyanobacteriorum]AQQ09799.1 Extracellular endo-alpha-(1->5)-L-arabinanase 1 precursor [Sedimentisphaera cyanobacteriorum]